MGVINRFNEIAKKIGLRAKIIILVVSLLLFLASSVMIETGKSITPFLNQQLELQGLSTAKYIADRSPEHIYRSDIFMLHTIIRDAKNSNNNIRYIFIIDEKDKVMVDTFGNAIPKGLIESNEVIASEPHSVSVIDTEEGFIRDIALPISGGKLGTVRIGMSEKSLLEAKKKMLEGIAFTTLLVLLIGISLTLYLSHLLATPFQRLIQATREVAAGNMKFKVPPWPSNDEAGELTRTFNDMTERIEQSAQQIEQLSIMRRGLAQKVMNVQEEERRWLSRELHDETSQSLASLRMGLKYVDDAQSLIEVEQRLDEVRQVLDDTFNGIRRLVTNLRPCVLDEGELAQAIIRYAREFEKRFGITIDMSLDEIAGLPREVASSLFRIVQEVLTNSARHAKASQISIILSLVGDDLHLTIEDDGVGFDVTKVLPQTIENQKYGLFGVQERVIAFDGKLQVESTPGVGTTIYVRIPGEVLSRGKNQSDVS